MSTDSSALLAEITVTVSFIILMLGPGLLGAWKKLRGALQEVKTQTRNHSQK